MQNTYRYGLIENLSSAQLFFLIFVDETANEFGISDFSAAAAIVLGVPVIPTRGKFAGSTPGTSIASMGARKLPLNIKTRLPTLTWASIRNLKFSYTRHVGAFIARWIPVVGQAVIAYDATKITIRTVKKYNSIVKTEDRQ